VCDPWSGFCEHGNEPGFRKRQTIYCPYKTGVYSPRAAHAPPGLCCAARDHVGELPVRYKITPSMRRLGIARVVTRVISGLRRGGNEIFAILGFYAA
jgi:hypothetical protein